MCKHQYLLRLLGVINHGGGLRSKVGIDLALDVPIEITFVDAFVEFKWFLFI